MASEFIRIILKQFALFAITPMGILIATIGYTILGIVLVIDKIILKRPHAGTVLAYVFWVGILNTLMLLVAPFGFHIPPAHAALTAIAAGISFFFATFFFYQALSKGEASHTPTIIGGFTPVATALIGSSLLATPLNIAEKTAFVFLVIGGFVMFLSERFSIRKILPWVLMAATCFGAANVLQKLAFAEMNFITELTLFSAGIVASSLTLLSRRRWRQEILQRTEHASPRSRALYIMSRAAAGVSTILIIYAVKLEHPAIVDALAGVRAAVVFIVALAITKLRPGWLKEQFRGWTLAGKIIATAIISLGLIGIAVQGYFQSKPIPNPATVTWGVTFSQYFSEKLGFDSDASMASVEGRSSNPSRRSWQQMYDAILTELRPQGIRLIASWDRIEPKEGGYDFADLDWQVSEAQKNNVPVILAVGQKVPRWPECHVPQWASDKGQETRDEKLLDYIKVIVDRYRHSPNLAMWQVENEPFLAFGECPGANAALIHKEVALVRNIDPSRQILMTDGGEFGDWYRASSHADVFGTTLYRKVFNRFFGEMTYPLTPEFYPLKKAVVQLFTGKPDQKYIVIELGMEPWTHLQIYEIPVEKQLSLFNMKDFKDNIAYARAARFDTYYLWGAEWWYWLKTHENNPSFWNAARDVIAGGKK